MKKPDPGKKPERITTEHKPGSTGPGGDRPARNRGKKIKRSENREGRLSN
jgi:hypothetical protein